MDDLDDILNEIVAECARLEAELLRGKRIVPTALDVERPGMAAVGGKRGDTASDWLGYLRWLDRTSADAERPARAAAASGASLSDAELDQLLAAAISEEPRFVECSDGETRAVFPKSYHSLRYLDALDAQARAVARELHIAMALAVAADASTQAVAPLAESECVRRWAWILTHEGPGLPFDENAVPLPEAPAWTKALTMRDWSRLLVAHHAVNGEQLRLVAAAFPPDPDDHEGSRLTLAGFLGSLAAEMEPGAARRLMRTTALGQVFATQVTKAASQREAMARAKSARDAA